MRDRLLLQTNPDRSVERKTRKRSVADEEKAQSSVQTERGRQHGLLCDLYTGPGFTLCIHVVLTCMTKPQPHIETFVNGFLLIFILSEMSSIYFLSIYKTLAINF